MILSVCSKPLAWYKSEAITEVLDESESACLCIALWSMDKAVIF